MNMSAPWNSSDSPIFTENEYFFPFLLQLCQAGACSEKGGGAVVSLSLHWVLWFPPPPHSVQHFLWFLQNWEEGEGKKEAGKGSPDWCYSSHLGFLVPSFMGPLQLVPSCSWWAPAVCLTGSLCLFWWLLHDFSLPCCPSIWPVRVLGNLHTSFALMTWGK